MHRAGRQVRFAPRALVMAESPSTLLGLWKQLVRWARGLLQTTLKHRDAVGDPCRGMFGLYLAFDTLTMIIMPGLQLLLALLPILALGGENHLSTGFWAWLGWLGLVLTLVIARRPATWNELERTGVVGLARPGEPVGVFPAGTASVGELDAEELTTDSLRSETRTPVTA